MTCVAAFAGIGGYGGLRPPKPSPLTRTNRFPRSIWTRVSPAAAGWRLPTPA